jgi:hypothetical protein
MRTGKPSARILILGALASGALGATGALAQGATSSATKPGGRLDSFQFKSVCEMQKRMPNATHVDCHCSAGVYERYVQQQLTRFDDMIKYYTEKMQAEPEKYETYARAADRQREQRKQFVDDSLRMDTQVFKDILRKAVQECPPR